MTQINNQKPIGVIVARFQVADLHSGHKHLITHVIERHEDVLIVLGIRTGVRTKRDPLTFEERKFMIEQSIPEHKFVIIPHEDHPHSSDQWSKNLDELITKTFPNREAVLYGARNSFIPYYSTKKFKTEEVVPIYLDSGTEVRKSTIFPHTYEAREAIIWELENRHPFMYSTVDLAIVDKKFKRVLLIGKKSHDKKFSFVGGHVGKGDAHAINTVIRESGEEVPGVEIGEINYIDSIAIDDPRYKGTPDGVMTTFYVAKYLKGDPTPGGDADFVKWVSYDELIDILVPWHKPLGELLLKKLNEEIV